FQFEQVLEVLLQLLRRGVGHVDEAIHTVEHGDAGALVEHLARHGVECEPHAESVNLAQIEWQEVEEEGALALGGDGEQISARGAWGMAVDILQIGRLPAIASAVVDDLALYLAFGDIDERHAPPTLLFD